MLSVLPYCHPDFLPGKIVLVILLKGRELTPDSLYPFAQPGDGLSGGLVLLAAWSALSATREPRRA